MKVWMLKGALLGVMALLFIEQSKAQEDTTKYTPYELLSSYYENQFLPFNKGNWYAGLAFGVEDRSLSNTTRLLDKVIEGGNQNFNLSFKGGYYLGNYAMVGLNIGFNQRQFVGTVLKESDTIQSNSISRNTTFVPNIRTSVPLTKNERLSFYTEIGLGFGFGNSITRDIKNLDDINKSVGNNFLLTVGISPGITFFAMENFAFEVGLNLLGYQMRISETTKNDSEVSREVSHNVNFKIDILTLDLGLAYYFGAKKTSNTKRLKNKN